jgi:hypothetical protein
MKKLEARDRLKQAEMARSNPDLPDGYRQHAEQTIVEAKADFLRESAEEVRYLKRLPVTLRRLRVLRSIPHHPVDSSARRTPIRIARPRGHRARPSKRASSSTSGSSGSDEPPRPRVRAAGGHLVRGIA